MTNAEARFNKSLRPRKPEGSLGRTAQCFTPSQPLRLDQGDKGLVCNAEVYVPFVRSNRLRADTGLPFTNKRPAPSRARAMRRRTVTHCALYLAPHVHPGFSRIGASAAAHPSRHSRRRCCCCRGIGLRRCCRVFSICCPRLAEVRLRSTGRRSVGFLGFSRRRGVVGQCSC